MCVFSNTCQSDFNLQTQTFTQKDLSYPTYRDQSLNPQKLAKKKNVMAPSQDASDHQDDITFLVGNPYEPYLPQGLGRGHTQTIISFPE